MDKELKILFSAILTMIFYGAFLVAQGAPFFIFPLNVIANALMTAAIVFSMKKFDWRNILILISAFLLLLQDPMFLSFFTSTLNTEQEGFRFFSAIIIITVNLFCHLSLLENSRFRIAVVFFSLVLSLICFSVFGLYGIFLSTVIGMILTVTSKTREVEFLKVYWMFFIFMILNQVVTLNL
ncbi:MAG: hypothetical protein J0G96_08480 [Flavobacteriia bacterium]|nr:hypothetical protein [Flavobacteriia bacterium]OJX36233.1 MAG: hypothetical protein BGO87_07170 [Flavobacteriia bacterium 40-80]